MTPRRYHIQRNRFTRLTLTEDGMPKYRHIGAYRYRVVGHLVGPHIGIRRDGPDWGAYYRIDHLPTGTFMAEVWGKRRAIRLARMIVKAVPVEALARTDQKAAAGAFPRWLKRYFKRDIWNR